MIVMVVVTLSPQVSWSPDSSQLISASGDKTVKLWDVGSNTAVTTFNMGADVMDQQLGCLWQKDHLLSISLSGYINYLDKNNPDRPLRTVKVGCHSASCLVVCCKVVFVSRLRTDNHYLKGSQVILYFSSDDCLGC